MSKLNRPHNAPAGDDDVRDTESRALQLRDVWLTPLKIWLAFIAVSVVVLIASMSTGSGVGVLFVCLIGPAAGTEVAMLYWAVNYPSSHPDKGVRALLLMVRVALSFAASFATFYVTLAALGWVL